MTWAHPTWFWGLLGLPLLVALQLARERQRRGQLGKLIAPRLQLSLAEASVSHRRRWLRLALLLVGLAFLLATLAQPRWGEVVAVQQTRGRDVLLVIDTSRSMLANDLVPSRLARVKLAAADLIGELAGDRVGLVAFAGSAFLQAPLTGDLQAVLASLQELDTDIIPLGGTNIAEALRAASDAFGKSESEDRALVLFTDGEDLDEQGVEAAQQMKGTVRIFTVGAGSPEGTVIALPNARGQMEYVKDPSGQIVKSRLDEKTLRAIAEATGGFYTHLQSGPAEMQQIYRNGLMQISARNSDERVSHRQIERFQWPLAAAIVFLVSTLFIGERRRRPAMAAWMIVGWLASTSGAHATNRGLELYQEEDYSGATEHFGQQLQKKPSSAPLQYDLGAAAYKAGQFEKAIDSFSQAIRSPDARLRQHAEYNLGNTLFQRGLLQKERPPKVQDWQNAIQHYEEALRVDPKDANAIYNRDVVKKLLEEKKEEQKKEDEKKNDDSKEGDKKDDQDKPGEKKDQKEKGDKGDQKDQGDPQKGDKGQEGKEGEQGKDGEPKEGQGQNAKDGKADPQGQDKKGQKPKQGQNGEPDKEAQQKAQKDANERAQKEAEERTQKGEGQTPQPKPQGEIKGTAKGDQEQQQREQAQQAAEDQAAAALGKMTEAQARSLLDSMRTEDVRVPLLNPKGQRRPGEERTIRNW